MSPTFLRRLSACLACALLAIGTALAQTPPGAPTRVTVSILYITADVGIFLALAFADLSTYVVTSVQLGIAFPDPVSGLLGSVAKFMSIFAISQIPLAIAEGILGVLVFRLLTDVARPELERLGVIKTAEHSKTGA